ncbi:MAG: helix-turn-helix domain-containing protein [Bacillota bacterium]|nr:helix-turn-helix domain-containing protein [Bacillota bacterium]
MELWEVFQKLVDEKKVKISDIARDTEMPYTTVDSIIKKKLKDIKFESAVKLADYFGVTVDYLATGKVGTIKETHDSIIEKISGIELLNDYGIKRLQLYLNEKLLTDSDCLRSGDSEGIFRVVK